MSVRSELGLMFVNKTGQTPDMSNGYYRGVALSGASANVNVSIGIHEFMLRHTRGRVPRPAVGFCIKRVSGGWQPRAKLETLRRLRFLNWYSG